MSPVVGTPYSATIHHDRRALVMHVVCARCGEYHTVRIADGADGATVPSASLALLALWMSSHTSGHQETQLREGARGPYGPVAG